MELEITKKYKDFIDKLRKSYKPQEICSSINEFDPTKHKMLLDFIDFENTKIKSLGVLELIDNDCSFSKNITDIGNLIAVSGYLKFNDSKINDLKNLRVVMGEVVFEKNQKDIGKLEYIGMSAWFEGSGITDLKNLKVIGHDTSFENSRVENLGDLTIVYGDVVLTNSKISKLGNLHSVNRIWLNNITDFGNLTNVYGSAFGDKKIVSLLLEHLDNMKNVSVIKKQICYVKDSLSYIVNKKSVGQIKTNQFLINNDEFGLIFSLDGDIIFNFNN